MRVRWTDTALEHLLAIYEYIAQNSPLYARQIVDRLTRRSEQIALFPLSGRVVLEYQAQDIRELHRRSIIGCIYRIKEDQLDILACGLHLVGSLLPPEL